MLFEDPIEPPGDILEHIDDIERLRTEARVSFAYVLFHAVLNPRDR